MKSSRLIALEIINKIFSDNSYSNIAIDKSLEKNDTDNAFVSALVYGVIERKITLDYYINKYLTSKPKPKVMNILRLGAYQIKFMDRVPNSAAINESVKLTRDIKQDYYSSLVNAVLRKIDADNEEITDLSIKHSVPEQLINMWIKQYGRDNVEGFLPAVNNRPPMFAIPNTMFVDADELCYELLDEGVDAEAYNDVVLINSGINISKSKAFNNGLFYIEDLSSFECANALGAKPGETVIDVCAAPGGKSFAIALGMKNEGKLLSLDIHQHRVDLIKSSAERMDLSVIDAMVNDASVHNDKLPMADRILCDVPCSGFGIIRRKPEIRYKELDSVKELPELQLKILTTSSKYLKNGGTLVYSTCTLNKKENEKVVYSFLEDNNDFSLISEKNIFPSEFGGDGFYYAVIKRND